MRAIILAAGIGSRLGELTNGNPKSMIKIGEFSLIHHQINACQKAGITDFVFVLGYKKEILKEHILSLLPENVCNFVYNPIYDSTNTLHSLWLAAQNYFDKTFIYFNADVLFLDRLLLKIIEENGKSELLLDSGVCAEEEVKLILKDGNIVSEIGKKLDPKNCAGEFIGVGKFSHQCLLKFKEFLQVGVETGESNNYFEFAVNLLCKESEIFAIDTDGLPCIEIDFPEDLERAKKLVYNQIKKEMLNT